MTEDHVNLLEQREWEAGPKEDLKLPGIYITQLNFEIVILDLKGTARTFRCSEYEPIASGAWRFAKVIIDSSLRDPKGEVMLQRFTYHPEIVLVNVPFMVIRAPKQPIPGEAV